MRNQHQSARLNRYAFLTFLGLVIIGAIAFAVVWVRSSLFVPEASDTNNIVAEALTESLVEAQRAQSGTGLLLNAVPTFSRGLDLRDARNFLGERMEEAQSLMRSRMLDDEIRQQIDERIAFLKEEKSQWDILSVQQATVELELLIEKARENIGDNEKRQNLKDRIEELIEEAKELIEEDEDDSLSPSSIQQLERYISRADTYIENEEVETENLQAFVSSFEQAIANASRQADEAPHLTGETLANVTRLANEDARWFNRLSMNERMRIFQQVSGSGQTTYGTNGLIIGIQNNGFIHITTNSPPLMYLFVTAHATQVFRTLNDARSLGYRDITQATNFDALVEQAQNELSGEEDSDDDSNEEENDE